MVVVEVVVVGFFNHVECSVVPRPTALQHLQVHSNIMCVYIGTHIPPMLHTDVPSQAGKTGPLDATIPRVSVN